MPSSRRRAEPTDSRGDVRSHDDTVEVAADEAQSYQRAVAEAAPFVPRSTVTRFDKIGAGAGIAYALVGFFASWLMTVGRVDPTNSSTVIAKRLVEVRGRLSAGALLTLFSLFFLLVFAAWLHRWLREAEGERGWLATLALAGAVLMAATVSIVVVLTIALTALGDYGGDAVVARTLLTLQWQALFVSFAPTAAFVGATSLIGSGTGQLPRWLSLSGVVIAFGLLIPFLAFVPFILSSLWTGLLAVFLLQRTRGRM